MKGSNEFKARSNEYSKVLLIAEKPLAGRIMPLSLTGYDDNEILPPANGFFPSLLIAEVLS